MRERYAPPRGTEQFVCYPATKLYRALRYNLSCKATAILRGVVTIWVTPNWYPFTVQAPNAPLIRQPGVKGAPIFDGDDAWYELEFASGLYASVESFCRRPLPGPLAPAGMNRAPASGEGPLAGGHVMVAKLPPVGDADP